jgi:hypothetical protein
LGADALSRQGQFVILIITIIANIIIITIVMSSVTFNGVAGRILAACHHSSFFQYARPLLFCQAVLAIPNSSSGRSMVTTLHITCL